MNRQTIALFRYQLLGVVNTRLLIVITAIIALAFVGSRFIAEIAIINSDAIALATLAEFTRYALVLLIIISTCHQISQDYELHQFERLLAMPISRLQYVLAQFFVLIALAFIVIIPVFGLMSLLGDYSLALYWALSLFLEMILVGQFAVLAILSLEKLPVAVVFTIAIYLLAKSTTLIELILTQSSPYYDQEVGFQLSNYLFTAIQYLLPSADVFAQNNVLLEGQWSGILLIKQLISVLIYSAFIQSIILIDFYRKEFNRA